MRMVDRDGRCVEIILRDLCDGRGPRQWIRVSWRGVLLGYGYYRRIDDALVHVDVESLVEIIELRPGPYARSGFTMRP